MSRHAKTQAILDAAIEILEEENPQTLRQCYYQLISRQDMENSRTAYVRLSNLLTEARLSGEVPWEWMEDRTRAPRTVYMCRSLADYVDPSSYRRDVWPTQPKLVEV